MRDDRGIPTRPSEYERRLLPDNALAHAPAQVVKTNAAAAEALDRHRKLIAAEREADIAARNAEGADQQAMKAALDAGKAAPKPSVNAKREAADKARATTAAAAALVEEKFAALADAVRVHHRVWANNLQPVLEATTKQAQATVAATAEAFNEFDTTVDVLAYLWTFDPERGKTQELRDGSTLIAQGAEVERRPAALLAALTEVAGEYQVALRQGESEIDHQAAEHARNLARKAIRHQQNQERAATAKTVPGFTVG